MIWYKVNEVNAISHSILIRIILNCKALSARSLSWFLIFLECVQQLYLLSDKSQWSQCPITHYTYEPHPKGWGYLCTNTMLIFEAKSMNDHFVDFFQLFSQSQWSQCHITLHSYESYHMVRPSVHNHVVDFFSFFWQVNAQSLWSIFYVFRICPPYVPIIWYKVNEVNAISHSMIIRIILNVEAISARSLYWFFEFFLKFVQLLYLLSDKSQWSQCNITRYTCEFHPKGWGYLCTITMLIFWGIVNEVNARSLCGFFKAFLGKVNEVNAISHYTHMNHPICWDYQCTITMLIFSAFLGKSMKSTHDHNDHFFLCILDLST